MALQSTLKRILILTSDAGFGHRSVSEALEAAFHERCDCDLDISVVNPMQDPELPGIIKSVETSYDGVVTEEPALYQLAYTVTEAPPITKLVQEATAVALNRTMKKILGECRPDAIVMPYPSYTQAVIKAMESLSLNVPLYTVVTDLVDVHRFWFDTRVSLIFVPTGHVYRQALDIGVAKSCIELTGLPVHPRFAHETRDQRTLREALGWNTEKMTALLVGSPRDAQTASIAHLLDRSGLDLQIAVVSGGNGDTDTKLSDTDWYGDVHLYGRVKNMPELMKASDFIICKAGGLIVTESLACGLPLVLCDALPGQESGNVRYITESGAGVWSPGPVGVLTTVVSWMTKGSTEFAKCREAARRLGKPRAAYSVVDRILRQFEPAI